MIPTSPNMVDAGPVRYAQIPSATSFICKTLYEMAAKMLTIKNGAK